ncbi:MAG: hypothetical protein AAFZ52_02690 [Bacteroidota bacterium]
MEKHPHWAAELLLSVLNTSFTADRLLANPEVTTDPDNDGGYLLGEKVAANVVAHRRTLPQRRYTNLEEVLSVPGLGPDKLDDLLRNFSTPADEAFQSALFAGPLGENWRLTPVTIPFRDDAGINAATAGLDVLRRHVARAWAELRGEDSPNGAILRLRDAYVLTYEEGHLGSFAFAQWWYYFDQDNWFSFEQIRLLCENYLGHHRNARRNMHYCVVQPYGIQPLNMADRSLLIPVVINYAERKLTVWGAELLD